MIDRRQFVRTAAAAAVGAVALTCSDGIAQSSSRRRAVGRGQKVFRSSGGQLRAEVRAARTAVNLAGRSASLYTFNGSLPGPRFEVRAADSVTLRLDNALGEETNLHYHGLHIPPTGEADNIFLHVPDGESFTYQFSIPSTHPAGLFWVHPHLHGTVARQVSLGLAMPFVIRGDIDALPEVAAAEEHILVLQDFELDSNGNSTEPSMPALMMGREGSVVTLGGAVNPVIGIRQGGLLRLRLVNGSVSRFYRLALEEHPLHIIGVDGGPLPEVRTVDEVLFVPGERLDILIEATRAGGSFRLLNLPYDRGGMGMGGMMGGGAQRTTETLATLQYRGSSERKWSLPSSLPASAEPLVSTSLPQRVFRLGMGMGMMMGGMGFTINGREFDASRIDSAPRLGTVEEWVYINDTPMDHPMHLHTNSFQVIGADGTPERAWRDIIQVRARQQARFRVRFDDFAGKTVQHCHILDHEDQGMMATVEMRE
jgi:FtsP/CotA-like multicopper oxidase with cupredoxin domain